MQILHLPLYMLDLYELLIKLHVLVQYRNYHHFSFPKLISTNLLFLNLGNEN